MRYVLMITLLVLNTLNPLYAHTMRPMIFDEIPLMPGLNLSENLEGNPTDVDVSIVEADVSGSLVREDIYEYYEDHLQKLGWQTVEGRRGVFQWGDKTLVIKIRNLNDNLTVEFTLKT